MREAISELHIEGQMFGFGHVAEAAVHRVAKGRKRDLLDFDRDGARLDFRKIEDVVDEIKQIGSGGIDVPGELDLCLLYTSPSPRD